MQHLLNEHKDGVSMVKQFDKPKVGRSGFTMVELLTVIVIIAILAAIIYPVFSSVFENNRQSTSISNMHDISAKIALYELDKHTAPPVLFGYVVTSTGTPTTVPSMQDALAQAQADGTTATYFPGLYPTYVNSVSEFTDPNNPVSSNDTSAKSTTTADTNTLKVDGDLVANAPGLGFYTADAYDSSPQITGQNAIDTSQYVTRYQPAWTGVTTSGNSPLPAAQDPLGVIYQHQLHWQFPPANTYVTCTTYHVPKADVVLVLFQDGSVHKFDSKTFTKLDGGSDPAKIDSSDATDTGAPGGIASANFWQITPGT